MLQTRVVGNIGVFTITSFQKCRQEVSTTNKFEILNNAIRYSTEPTTVIWILTQPISNYYGDTEKVITF